MKTAVEVARHCLGKRRQPEGILRLDYSHLVLASSNTLTPIVSTVYQPLVCLVLQGAKEVSAGSHRLICQQGHMILVSHQLPVVSRIVSASIDHPYIAAILPLDRDKVLQYYNPANVSESDASGAAIISHETGPEILSAVGRLIALDEEKEIAPIVAPLVEDEIHARLLHSPMGSRMARQMWHDDRSTRISRVIKLIGDDLAGNLSIPDLAEAVGMSKSSLHTHFKAVTGMSPLAYIKELRLLKAQSYVRDSNLPISRIGYDVGYDSPAQFSREYSRKFLMSPRQDRLHARQFGA